MAPLKVFAVTTRVVLAAVGSAIAARRGAKTDKRYALLPPRERILAKRGHSQTLTCSAGLMLGTCMMRLCVKNCWKGSYDACRYFVFIFLSFLADAMSDDDAGSAETLPLDASQ